MDRELPKAWRALVVCRPMAMTDCLAYVAAGSAFLLLAVLLGEFLFYQGLRRAGLARLADVLLDWDIRSQRLYNRGLRVVLLALVVLVIASLVL
jgi:hypothetical protein